MKFSNPQLEKAWQEDLARSKRTHDAIAMIISIIFVIGTPLQHWVHLGTPVNLAYFAGVTLSALAIIFLALRSSAWYHQHRCMLLCARQISIVVLYSVLIGINSKYFDLLYPINPVSRVRMLLILPAIAVNIMLSAVMPLHFKAPVGAFAAAAGCVLSWRRCMTEATLFPREFGWYRSVLTSLDGFLRLWAPLQIDLIQDEGPPADITALSDVGACVATQVSMQMVSLLITFAVLFTDETYARWGFLCRYTPLEATVGYAYPPLLALSLVVAVAEAYFAFYVF